MAGVAQLLFTVQVGGVEDIVVARQRVRAQAQEMGFSVLDQTRIVTAVSELARNVVVHAQAGSMSVFRCQGRRRGMRIDFADSGPGIPDVARALEPGYSSAGSLGLGLQGARRLMDTLEIDSAPGRGTTVTVYKWL